MDALRRLRPASQRARRPAPRPRISPPIYDDPAAVASLFDGDNLDFAASHTYGLTDALSDEPVSKRGNIGD